MMGKEGRLFFPRMLEVWVLQSSGIIHLIHGCDKIQIKQLENTPMLRSLRARFRLEHPRCTAMSDIVGILLDRKVHTNS